MLGWIRSIFELIGYIFGFGLSIFDWLSQFVSYVFGFVTGMNAFVVTVLASMPWLAPFAVIAGIWLTVAIVRLCVSLGGHSG